MNVGHIALEGLEKFGEYTALYFEGKGYTNVERHAYAARMALVLRDRGIGPGDRVLVMMPNSPIVTAAFQAIWKLGAVIVPVAPQLNAREVGYLIRDSEVAAALTTPVLAARVGEAAEGADACRSLLAVGETSAAGFDNIEPDIETADPVDDLADRADDDLALLLYTSGTTGRPKGVMLTHYNLLSNARSVSEATRIPPGTPMLLALPLSHSFGVMNMNIGYLLGTVGVLLTHFDPKQVFEAIERYKIRRFSVVPTMLNYLIHHPEREKYDTSSLERVYSGAAALPQEVRIAFERTFGCKLFEGYGLSECAPVAAAYPDGEDYRPGSVGKAIGGVEITIRDDAGRTLAPGERGEICIQGPNVMKGYWKLERETAEALDGGVLHTGDVGYLDEEGYLFITDRKKDLIIKGGENISPREIEEAIYEHPAVAEVAVVGAPSVKYGEEIVAFIALKSGQEATEEEIRAHLEQCVTKFKQPCRILFRPMLPRNMVGKILKKNLREEVEEALGPMG